MPVKRFTMLKAAYRAGLVCRMSTARLVTISTRIFHDQEHQLQKADAKGYRVGCVRSAEVVMLMVILFTERIEDIPLHDANVEKTGRDDCCGDGVMIIPVNG